MKKTASLLLFLATVWSASLSAETLATYDFKTDTAPIKVAPGMSAGSVIPGKPFTDLTDAGGGRSEAAGDLFARGKTNMRKGRLVRTTPEAAVEHGTCFEFTVTPDKNKKLNLEGFSAKVGGQVLGGSKDPVVGFTAHFFVRASVDNYASDVGTAEQVVAGLDGGKPSNPLVNQEMRALLNGPAFKGVTTPVTFRLYFYIDTTDIHFSQVLRMDDFTVVGQVVAR